MGGRLWFAALSRATAGRAWFLVDLLGRLVHDGREELTCRRTLG
jgi:hypothetical protein